MELYAMTPLYSVTEPIDLFTELIWTDRYRDCGDFELYLPANACLNPHLAKSNVLRLKGSDRYMIIEDTKTITSKAGKDPMHKIVGRDLSSVLDRRIIWEQIDFTGTVHNLIKRILNENVISPTNQARAIPNFIFLDSSGGRMEEIIEIQLRGENVLTTIVSLCEAFELGFKVLPYENGGFSFQLYAGEDRSYSQDENPWVVFSPEYENIADTTLIEKTSSYKNTALVYNEYNKRIYESDSITETLTRSEIEVFNNFGEVSGLDRREIFINSYASHNKNDEEGTEYTQNEYNAILTAEGKDTLGQYEMASVFTGTIEPYRQFVLNRDFYLGDIVSIENEYGQTGKCRVIEVIYNQNPSGESILPSFENVDETTITDI